MFPGQAICRLSLFVAAFALPACGGKSFERGAGGTNGDTDSGGKAHGDSSQGGTATVTGGGAVGVATGGVGQSNSAQCDGYNDDGPANIPVRILNETKAPLYLGPAPACGSAPLFKVADAAGNLLSPPGLCQTTCQQLLTGGAISCPPIPCPAGEVLTLQPSEATSQLWNGLYTEAMMLAPECRTATDESTCERVAAVKPGVYTFKVTAGSTLECSATYCMMCTPSSSGGCTTFGAVVTGRMVSAETTLRLDGSYGLGGPGGDGEVNSVEIVFKD